MEKKHFTAIIFGGARGIGEATAKCFANAGYSVFVGDVLEESGRGIEGRHGEGQITFQTCDVVDASQIDSLYDRAITDTGRVDVVFNNVGIARYGEVDLLSLDDWNLTLTVNLTAQFLSCKRAVAEMKKAGGGTIINMASILGHASQKTTAAYAASKAGVMGLTRTVAIDHAVAVARQVARYALGWNDADNIVVLHPGSPTSGQHGGEERRVGVERVDTVFNLQK